MRGIPYDEAHLKALFAQGASHRAIAQELGRTEGAIAHKLHAMGLRAKLKWDANMEMRLEDMVTLGWSDEHIAGKFMTTTCSVKHKRQELGLAVGADYYSAYRLSQTLGTARTTIRAWINKGYFRTRWVGKHFMKAVTYEALCDFLADPMFWPLWEPRYIMDIPLQAYAKQLRVGIPKFLTVNDIGRALGLSPGTVTPYVASPHMRKLLLSNTYYVRVDWFKEWHATHCKYPIIDATVLEQEAA